MTGVDRQEFMNVTMERDMLRDKLERAEAAARDFANTLREYVGVGPLVGRPDLAERVLARHPGWEDSTRDC